MVRPLSGANALAEAMGAQFEQIQREAFGRLNDGELSPLTPDD